ncbi:MAG: glycoside hydrolase TIM-barrel-like domain-containing protein [Rickettsiales bacterium]
MKNSNKNEEISLLKKTKLEEINNLENKLKYQQSLLEASNKKLDMLKNFKQFTSLASQQLDKELFGFNILSSYANRAVSLYKSPIDEENQNISNSIKDLEKQIKQANADLKKIDKIKHNKLNTNYKFNFNAIDQKFNINNYNLNIEKLQVPFGYAKITGVLIDAYLQDNESLVLNLNNNQFLLNQTQNQDKTLNQTQSQDKTLNQTQGTNNNLIENISINQPQNQFQTNNFNNNQNNSNDFVTLVFAISNSKIDHLSAIEINNEILQYDIDSYENNFKSNNTINANYKNNKIKITIYLGDEDQEVHKSLESYYGINNCPAYKGIAYAVFENFPFKEQEAISSIKFHVLKTNTYTKEIKTKSKDQIEGIVLVPGCGEFVYDTIIRTKTIKKSDNSIQTIALNCCNPEGIANVLVSLNQLAITFPNLKHISLVVCWFVRGKFENNELDVDSIVNNPIEQNRGIFPLVEYDEDENFVQHSTIWRVGKFVRNVKQQGDIKANVVTKINNNVLFGGTPSDESIKNLIIELKRRGYTVMLNPMLMVDLPEKPWRGMITYKNDSDVVRFFTGQSKTNPSLITKGYNDFIMHYAKLFGRYIDEFSLGSEFYGLSTSIIFALEMKMLAKEVRNIVGQNVKILYGANYDEYHQKINNRILNILHTENSIDLIGIHAYPPITNTNQSEQITAEMIENGWQSGEGYEYSNTQNNQLKYSSQEEAWKNFTFWQQNHNHIENIGQIIEELYDKKFDEDLDFLDRLLIIINNEDADKIGEWKGDSKKIWLDEVGCASVHNSPNEPNIFIDKSCINGIKLPKNSNGNIDLEIQNTFINGTYNFWKNKKYAVERLYWWCWEARPFPCWPCFNNIWSDTHLWPVGHYLNGKIPLFTIREIIIAMFEMQAKKQNFKIKTLNCTENFIYIEFENILSELLIKENANYISKLKLSNNINNINSELNSSYSNNLDNTFIEKNEFIKTLSIYGLNENIYGFILNANSSINEVLSQLMLISFFDIKITKDNISIIENKFKINNLNENNTIKLTKKAEQYLKENANKENLLQNSYDFLLHKFEINKIDNDKLSSNENNSKVNKIEESDKNLIINKHLNSSIQKENNIINQYDIIDNSLVCMSNIKNNLIKQVYISYFDLHLNYSQNIIKTNANHIKNEKINYFNLKLVTEKHKIKFISKKIIQNNNIESIFYNVIVGFEYIDLRPSDLIIIVINELPIITKILLMKINNNNILLKLTVEDLNSYKMIIENNQYRYNENYNLLNKQIEYINYEPINKINPINNIELIRLNGNKFRDSIGYLNTFLINKEKNNLNKIFIFYIISYKIKINKLNNNNLEFYSSCNLNNDINFCLEENILQEENISQEESTNRFNTNIDTQEQNNNNNNNLIYNITNIEQDIVNDFFKKYQHYFKLLIKQQYAKFNLELKDITNLNIKNKFSINLNQNLGGKLKTFISVKFENRLKYFIDTESKFYITTNYLINNINQKYNNNYINPIILNSNLIKIGNEFMLYANCNLISEKNNEYEYEFSNLIRGVFNTFEFCDNHKKNEEFIDMQSVKNCIKVNENDFLNENYTILYSDNFNQIKEIVNIDNINIKNFFSNVKTFPIIPFNNEIYLKIISCTIQKKENFNNYLKFRDSQHQDNKNTKFVPNQNQIYDKLILYFSLENLTNEILQENENIFSYEIEFHLKKQYDQIEIIYENSNKIEWINSGNINSVNINSKNNSINFYLHNNFIQNFQFLCNNISAIEKIFIIYKYKKNNQNQIVKLEVYNFYNYK